MSKVTLFLLLLVFAIFSVGLTPSAKVQTNESRCFDMVQGHIAWDYNGSTTWATGNVQNLCRGTFSPSQPGRCFQRAMHGGINWGGGTRWEWKNALELCAGTSDAYATISCFQDKIHNGVAWAEAIKSCNHQRCVNLVQGQIAWNYNGSKTWAADNVANLCRGSSNPTQPPRCFERAMHGGINWGGGTQWQWKNASDLCGGTSDASRTITCFQAKIRQGASWQQAIEACKGDTGS
jgi:hypothetical protein